MSAINLNERTVRLAYGYAEAADALSISVSMLHKLVARGELNPTRVGRRCLFPVSRLEAFLADGGEGSY
jgi:excisionase family DNA binding protein